MSSIVATAILGIPVRPANSDDRIGQTWESLQSRGLCQIHAKRVIVPYAIFNCVPENTKLGSVLHWLFKRLFFDDYWVLRERFLLAHQALKYTCLVQLGKDTCDFTTYLRGATLGSALMDVQQPISLTPREYPIFSCIEKLESITETVTHRVSSSKSCWTNLAVSKLSCTPGINTSSRLTILKECHLKICPTGLRRADLVSDRFGD